MTKQPTENCILDGFDGPKPAHCHPLLGDSPSHKVEALDGSICIHVGRHVVASRFADYDKPTFYYS